MSESTSNIAPTSSDEFLNETPEKHQERLLGEKSDLEYWFTNFRILLKSFRMKDPRVTLEMLTSELDNMVMFSLQPNESCPTVEERFAQFKKSEWYRMQCVLIREKYHDKRYRLRAFSTLAYRMKLKSVVDVSEKLNQILQARRYGARSQNPWLRELDETDPVKDKDETQTRDITNS